MAKSLSVVLRKRVIGVIERGASCRQAAARFGVSASSAIRCHVRLRTMGDATPKRQGAIVGRHGSRRSHVFHRSPSLIDGAGEGSVRPVDPLNAGQTMETALEMGLFRDPPEPSGSV